MEGNLISVNSRVVLILGYYLFWGRWEMNFLVFYIKGSYYKLMVFVCLRGYLVSKSVIKKKR